MKYIADKNVHTEITELYIELKTIEIYSTIK